MAGQGSRPLLGIQEKQQSQPTHGRSWSYIQHISKIYTVVHVTGSLSEAIQSSEGNKKSKI